MACPVLNNKIKNSMKYKKSQQALEVVALIVVVISALIAVKVYLTRSVSGRLRGLADELGPQYDSDRINSTTIITSESTTTDSMLLDPVNNEYLSTVTETITNQTTEVNTSVDKY